MKNTLALLLCGMIVSTAYAKTEADHFSGYYTQKTVDTGSEITLLPDQTFCYAFMGGNLDLMIAGHWQKNNDNSITIKEHRQDMPTILLRTSENEDDLKETKPKMHFSGYSLADDLSMVFGVSRDDLRPILSRDHNGFNHWYKIDVADKTNSVFIGRVNSQKVASREGYEVYQIAEYAVDFSQVKVMNVYLNNNAARARMDAVLTLKGNRLTASEEDYGFGFTRQKPLKTETIEKIKANCIAPILTDAEAKIWTKPKQEFEIELPIKNITPYFEKDKNKSTPQNGRRVFNG